MDQLDRSLDRSNRLRWRKLQTWAGVLDAAGWCVALSRPDGGVWLSPRAIPDLAKRGWNSPEDISAVLPAGTRTEGGASIWADDIAVGCSIAPAALTAREQEVFNWLHAGKSDAEISVILGCAVRTVEKHVANLYRKLGVANRAAAILHPIGFAR